MELTSKQRAQLRSLANSIDTILIVGKDGIGNNLVKQANDALEARELIKGRVLENSLLSPREAAEELAKEGVNARVINIHTIKPLDEELLVKAAKETKRIVTVEEHSVIGGLGSAVCEALSDTVPTPVHRIGMKDTFGESGPAVELLHKYGLDAEGICREIRGWMK